MGHIRNQQEGGKNTSCNDTSNKSLTWFHIRIIHIATHLGCETKIKERIKRETKQSFLIRS